MPALPIGTSAPLTGTSRFSTAELCVLGAAGAVSFLLMQFAKIPVYDFLKYDPSDVPPALCALAMGPLAGVLTVLLRVLLKLMIMGGDPIGIGMNLVASGSYVMVLGTLARLSSPYRTQLRALAVATLTMTVVMLPVNYFVLLHGEYVPGGQVLRFLVVAITPFNLFKGCLNGWLVLHFWPRLRHALRAPR